MLHERGGALTGLKHFWSTNSFFGYFSQFKNVMHVNNSAAFSIRSAVFSEECCMENIVVICLMFIHVNALTNT